jgi:hypothetical protein
MKHVLIAAVVLSALVAPPLAGGVLAQGANPGQLTVPGPGPTSSKPATGGPREKAPPALPGARAEPTAVAPAAKNAMELPPNEALFDAINRGDLAVAKDAVARGADLDAKNVLGLTPIELAVDLGRNQLSFYLLSLRGGTSAPRAPNAAQIAAMSKPPSRAERLAEERAARAEKQARQRSAAADASPPPGPQVPRLFSGDGGQPNPGAGFLGFNAVR